MRFGWFCLLVALVFTVSESAFARDIYVDNVNGDDRNDGSQRTTSSYGIGPCRSITRALKHAERSDRLIIINTGEPYRESFALQGSRHSGTESFPFQIIGNGAVIDGTADVDTTRWENVEGDLFRFQPNYLSHQQLFLDGRPADRVRVDSAPGPDDLEPLQWCLYRGYIYFKVEENRIPHQYNLTHTHERVGITLYAVRHLQMFDITVQGFALDGINAHDTVTDTIMAGVTSRGNGRSGISIGGACRVSITASLIGNNGLVQVRGEGCSKAELTNCDVVDDDVDAPDFTSEGRAEIIVEGTLVGE